LVFDKGKQLNTKTGTTSDGETIGDVLENIRQAINLLFGRN
jgi:predicted RNase H-like HicB family nuclease|tara:strand:- start:3318 stop:3440 length:123 start_codon:yes stop_codon:yes gene_type:complete